VTYEEVSEVVAEVAAVHLPEFPSDMPARTKIEGLEDHLLYTARGRGILEEARLALEDQYELIDDKWKKLTGWEMYLNGKPKSNTDIDEAKRQLDPSLFEERRLCIKCLRQVGNQIRRLEKDDAVASRSYTMLTGS
jgi:hypothetical protein